MTAPRIRRVLETALYCRDLAATAAFYRALFPAAPLRALGCASARRMVLRLSAANNSNSAQLS